MTPRVERLRRFIIEKKHHAFRRDVSFALASELAAGEVPLARRVGLGLAAVLKAAAMPEVKAAIVKQGLEVFAASAAEVDAIRRNDLAMIAKLIKAANIRPLD